MVIVQFEFMKNCKSAAWNDRISLASANHFKFERLLTQVCLSTLQEGLSAHVEINENFTMWNLQIKQNSQAQKYTVRQYEQRCCSRIDLIKRWNTNAESLLFTVLKDALKSTAFMKKSHIIWTR